MRPLQITRCADQWSRNIQGPMRSTVVGLLAILYAHLTQSARRAMQCWAGGEMVNLPGANIFQAFVYMTGLSLLSAVLVLLAVTPSCSWSLEDVPSIMVPLRASYTTAVAQ